MKKRVLSLLMAIAICLSMLPSAALAEIPGTGTNEVQTEQQITDEQKPEEQIPDEQKPDEQKPDEQNPEQQKPDEQKPDEQKPDEQNPDKQNPDEQKPAKAPRKAAAAETHTGDHGEYTLPEGETWQGVSSLPSDSGYYFLTEDVTINSTWSPANGTVLCLNGYGISMDGNGPVIEAQPGVTFTLCDCNGNGGGITHKSGRGAGVLVGQSAVTEDTAGTNTAVFNMYGGAIYNNYPQKASGKNAASASGVLIGGGTFNMYGGKITGNGLTDEESLGGGVFVANQGSFLMSGGEISGNHATEGGGVFVGGLYGYHDFSACSGGTFTMSGGSITGNSGTGGGVYVSAGSDVFFTVSGSAQITGNTGSNVYLNKNKDGQSNTIIVNGTLDRTASIGVSVETANQAVAENISAKNAERFTSDNDKYELQYDSTSQTLTLVGHDNHPICGDVTCTHGNKHDVITNWRSISTEAELNAVIMGGCYYLTQDVKIKDPWSPANGVTLCLNGHSITLVGYDNSSVIKVESGTFTLCDCSGDSGKITNGYKDGGSQKYLGRGVSVSKNGTFTMYGGSITGNTEGGVFVGSNRTFTMNGGSITGNTVTGSGGGVYVASGAEFTMNGGEISGNTSSSYGGGVYVYNGAEFTMTGGSITGNAASSNENKSYGGGVYVQKDAIKFTMTGGSITGNKAKYGGGVWTGASFTVSGNVNITGNVGIDSKTASNVYPSLVKITIGREGLKPEAKIGVTYGNTIKTGEFVTIATGAKDSCTADNFTADAGEPYGIKVERNGAYVDVNLYNGLPHIHYRCNGKDENGAETCNGIGHTEEEVLEFTPWTKANELPTTSGEYYLTTDVTLDSAWDLKGVGSNEVRFVLCLNGHSIKLKDGASGNVINIGKNATLALCDCNGSKAGNGKITGSKASGVNIEYNGAFVMYGGSISGNGTGVSNDKRFHMYGGSITGNNRGVNVNSNDFIVAGKVNITGNTTNVYLPAGKTITVSGALGTGAQIGVTTAKELADGSYLTIAKGIDKNSSKYTLTETDLKAFTSDSSYGKRLNGNSIIFTKGDLHIHALCGASCTHTGTHSEVVWQPLTYDAKTQTLYYGGTAVPNEVKEHITGYDENNNAVRGKYRLHTLPSGNYYLTEDITLAGGTVGQDEIVGSEIYIKGYDANVNLCLNGHTLSATNANSAVISVKETQKLTMCDCEGGGKLQTAANGNIVVQAYGDSDNNRKGTFTMYGGTISGARFGVWANNSCGSFNMFGGTITGNENGVSISSNASFTIGGTVNITGNTKNVDLAENETITIDKSLTQDARIGITIAKEPTAEAPVQFAAGANNAALDYTGIFTPDAKNKSYVVSKGGDGSLFLGLHQHSWSYTANGATITATCTAASCPLKDKNGGSYTITVPDNLTYDGNGKAATVTGSIPGVTEPTITYKKGDTTLDSAPTDVGKYTASITLGEGKNAKTAGVEYSITQATPQYTLPVNLEAVYGSTLASVKLPTGWAWENDTQSVGSVGEHTFKATYTPGDANFHAVTGIGVTVTVNKAPVTIQIAGMPTGPIAYGDTFVLTITQTGDNNAVPANWTKFSRDRHFEYLREQSNPEKGEFKFQATGVCPGNGCSRKFTVEFESDTHKGSLTVSTPNVTKKTLTGEDLVFGGLTTDFTKTYDGSTSFTKASVEIRSNAKVNATDALPAVNGSYVYNSKDVKDAQKVIFTSERTESGNYILPAGLTVEHAAGITQATPTYTVPAGLTAKYGQTLADISLPDGWSWMDSTLSVGDVSDAAKTFMVKFTPTDTNNYKTVENIEVSVTVNKADGRSLKTADLTQKFTDVSDHAYTPDWSVLPGGQNWSYNREYRVSTGSNVTLTKHDFAADGSLLTYAVSGGKAGDKITITLKASCGNYEDFTITLNITLTAKDIPNVTAKDIVVTYDGNPIPADKITGTADVAGTWKWKAGTAVTDVSDSGTKTVVFKPADSVNYAEVEKTITVTINRATPTGEPKYTEITTGGKTLADAALMLAGGTISFDEGKLEWIDEKGNKLSDETVVEANKPYTWRFIPANTNYTTLTGTIVLYPASTGIVIYTPVNDAIFLSGANQIVAPGSAATFRINKNFGEFRSVAVDGVTLDKSNYRAWSGSTYVKLTPAYMKTLSAGTHTLAVYFTGATATTTFTISAGSSNPATGAGDFAGVGAAVAMAAVSLLGAAAVLRRK